MGKRDVTGDRFDIAGFEGGIRGYAQKNVVASKLALIYNQQEKGDLGSTATRN